jgi:hypothetical protein
MRTLFLLAFSFLTSISLFAQHEDTALCDSLIQVDVDSVAGVYNIGSRRDIIISKAGKDVLEFVFLVVDRVIIVHVSVLGDTYCVEEISKINFVFKDGTTLELPNNGKFNCDGEFSVFFGGGFGKKRELNILQTKPIEYVKVGVKKSVVYKDRKNYVEANIPADKSKLIMQTMLCIEGY